MKQRQAIIPLYLTSPNAFNSDSVLCNWSGRNSLVIFSGNSAETQSQEQAVLWAAHKYVQRRLLKRKQQEVDQLFQKAKS